MKKKKQYSQAFVRGFLVNSLNVKLNLTGRMILDHVMKFRLIKKAL